MRLRRFIWIALCLLVAAGAWLLFHSSRTAPADKAAHRAVFTSVHSSATAPDPLSGLVNNAGANRTSAVKTNRYAYRLTNTARPLGELVHDRRAILLENALIDTGSPLNFSIPKHLRAAGDPGAYIVQSRGPITAAFRAALARAGAEIISYIPNDAYLVRLTVGGAGGLAAQPPVQSVIPYEPYYKIQASLLGLAVEQKYLPANAQLNLGLFTANAAQTIQQIEKLGAQVVAQERSPFGPVVRVQPPADWTALAALPGVQIVEAWHPRVQANDLSRQTTGVASDTQVSTNYLNLTGQNVMVAVSDSGIDATHPDLTGRVLGLTANDLMDIDGHGTHVAGIIAGDGTESTTVTNAQGSIMPATNGQFRGMAPKATLFSMHHGGTDSDQQLQETAALTNALISNNSWTYEGDNAYDLAAASYDAATRDALPEFSSSQPVLFVFSAGNGGQLNRDNGGGGGGNDDGTGGNPDTVFSPGTAKNVITVGALEQLRNIANVVTNADGSKSQPWQPASDSSAQVAGFSARGNVGINLEGDFGRYKPDVVAPGTFVISTRSSQWTENAYYNPTNDNVTTLADMLLPHTRTDPALQFYVFNTAIGVTINAMTPAGAPTNTLPIDVWQGTDPNTQQPDIGPINNTITIPPDGALSPLNTLWQCAVTNTTGLPLPYTLSVDVQTTNNFGNYYQALTNLNDSLDGFTPPHYYRYESGTSMSAADVSGVLALMEDYFTNTLHQTPSPALLKALLINGARPTGSYNFQVNNSINYEGWGLVNLPNSLPTGITNQMNAACDNFYVDQSPTNALATGDSHTYVISIDTNNFAQYLPLQITLAWTDPPGDPITAIKLVNNLDLVVTNMDTGDIYFGNNIPAGSIYNNAWNTNSLATTNAADLGDSINNIEQVLVPPLLAGHYSITVIGREVNVNAVTLHTNSVVQDFALVIACVSQAQLGEVPTAITVTDKGIVSNPTGAQDVTFVMTTNNTPLMNQMVGASSPLLGTNTLPTGTNTMWPANGLITFGMTNQWHFYVVTNPVSNPPDFTNAAFITFMADTLSIPREGVFANSPTNATRPEADIDLYVAGPFDPNAPALTNLDPGVIGSCINGAGGDAASVGRGGTEFVIYTNSAPGDVYYIGVKSEDRMASEYAFIPIFTRIPFGQLNGNGDQVVNGLNVPVPIPNGSPARPQSAYVFAVAPMSMQIERVVVTNTVLHQNFGNLVGILSHGYNGSSQAAVTLNQHDEPASPLPPGPYTMIYDDTGANDIGGSQPSDGPGSLKDFTGQQALGVWILTETDNALTQTGAVQALTLLIRPHKDITSGETNTVQAKSWFYDYVDVPPGYTNLSVFATNLPPTSVPALQLYLNVTNRPGFTNYLEEADLMNGTPPGNSISYGPPLQPARYWVGVYNPDSVAHDFYLLARLGGSLESVPPTNIHQVGPSLSSDVVASDSINISDTDLIASVNVGIVVAHPRISDLTFTLVSPAGQRVLLMENRGDDSTNGAGSFFTYSNFVNSTATGGAAANTNYLAVPNLPGGFTVPITYNFYTVPDEMTVYAGNDPTTFYLTSPNLLLDTGFTNNPPVGPNPNNTLWETINVTVPPGYTNITIIMNQFGNPYATVGDAWDYTAGAAITNYAYLMFTEDTNLATLPIKYAVPPFGFTTVASNYTLCNFEQTTNGLYRAPINIYDAFGGWFLPTNRVVGTNSMWWTNNEVSVITDPFDSLGDHVGSNFLALANGTITRSIPTVIGRQYNVTFWYRGPGIAGWWRGEGDATDSSFPEGGNNGSLIGRFNFPAGEVGQAFELQDVGQPMEFAGTNTYVQVPQSPSLDVGAGGGLTVEGWINPTNVTQQMPLVEWLAKIPVFTNNPDTNFSVQAGPFLDRATGHYYYLLSPTNWTTSEIWATNLGGHLVTLDTANEQNWVRDAFGNFASTNRNLWIGLTNGAPGKFVWSSGLTNIVYTNWANGQPNNSCGTANYTFMLGDTNRPGLWTLADNKGFTCAQPGITNVVYGVVEVDGLQPNGVQFWISVTNTPGTTNAAFVSSNGCLYADLVDVSNLTHEIFSAPGLVQSNIYQHVAVTYDTNSGLAMLYYNGTNVATTNLGVFFPKTGGDVLLGKDMSLLTNNYYGGEMDEMSIYGRALSAAEIGAIYRVSATATNGLTGKFDPSVTPAYGLAEAQVVFGATTSVIFGVNNQWELNSFTFTATSNAMPLTISGLEPGILLDDFAVSETPLANLYYLPEQSLNELAGQSPNGTWTLQIWDNRANAAVTPADAQLLNWELQFVLQTNVLLAALPLGPQNPTTITVPPGQIVYLSVAVPNWASWATNILDSASGPVDLLFNPTNEPAGLNPGDQTLLTASSSGIGSPILAVNSPFPLTQPNQAGQSYFLGVHNGGTHAVTATVEVDFDITTLSNSVPVSGVLNTNDTVRYFAYDVSSNAFEATFQLLQLSGNADLVVRKGPPLPTLFSSDYGSFNTGNADENIYVLTNSTPVPLSPGRWYLGVFKRDAGPVSYTVLAKELDATSGVPGYAIIDLTNRVPLNFTAGPGAALTNFFRFNVANTFFLTTNAVGAVTTNIAGSIHFALYNLSGNGDLTVQTNAPPLAPPFFESSQQPGRAAELITIRTNGAVTNLVAQWYLGVPNLETNPITCTIVAVLETNIVFPAFPSAEGAGADAVGGRFGGVYHVTSLADSGAGTLRDAVGVTNRTVVFDVSGTINLSSPLVITNSFITIAGQTAPGDGITVAGNVTTVQSAHDVVIRYVRSRPNGGAGVANVTVFSDGFENHIQQEGITAGSYIDGWQVVSGDVDVFDPGSGGNLATADTGTNCLDLNGFNPGSIATNFITIPGQQYRLSFAYTKNASPANPGYPFFIASANIAITGHPLITLATPAGMSNNYDFYDWQTTNYVFTAAGPSTTVQFSSLNSGSGGMLLDSITVSTSAAFNANFGDSLQFTNVSDVIADHISAEWSTNNLVSVLNSTNVTVQWSVMADSIYDPVNPHGYGSRLRYGNGALTFHHNLYADNYNANPRLGDNLKLDFVNNVIYNWGLFAGFSTNDIADNPLGFVNELNYVGNYLIAGPNSVRTNIAFSGGTLNTWIFQTNNFMDSNRNGILDGADTGGFMFNNPYTAFQVPFPPMAVSIDEAFLAYERVLDFAGAAMDKRDAADTNIVGGVRSQTGVIIGAPGPLPSFNPTLAFLDTDQDGIPDFWETTLAEFPTNFSANFDRDGDGYNDLEEHLNWLGAPHALTVTNTPIGVDLMQLFGKTGNLSFSVTNAVQGYVYLTNVLNNTNSLGIVTAYTNTGPFSNSIAVFSPTNNLPFTNDYSGYASFDIFVTNNSTIAYFGPVTVSVMVSAVPITYANNTNYPPVLSTNLPDLTINELTTLTVTNTATDANTNQTLTYTVTMIVDTNAMIASNWPTIYATTSPSPVIDANGIITWTPSEAQGPGVYIITTVVTDNGIPPLSATNSFTVVVNETNAAPFWQPGVPSQANYAVNELTPLSVTNTASDSDIPPNPLAYAVTMSIDTNAMNANGWPLNYATTNPPPVIDTNGIITWTPGEAQGPGVYILTTVVTDTNIYALTNRSLSATNRFTVTVNETNTAPFWPANVPSQTNYIVNEQMLLTVMNTATDLDIPPNPLTYQLIGPPGAGIDANGIITWMPTEAQGPGFYTFTTIVTDTNIYALTNRSLSATNSFTVTVYEVNTAPYWTNSFPLVTMDELTTNLVNAAAWDTDLPANTLSYALTNSPTWAVIDPNSGIITLTPQEADGPGTNVITVMVTDNGAPPLSATTNFTVVVNEVNTAPFWPPGVPSQTNYDINPLSTLFVTNTAMDLDIPPNPLTYQLFGPLGAVIDTNGIITWTPTLAQGPGFYTFTTIVTDTNIYALTNQSLSATNSFTVTVFSVAAPFVFTQPATSVTGTTAQLNGMATPNGLPTTAWFQWGTNTLYGNQTPPVSAGNSFNVVYTTNQISGLVTNMPYHFRLVASNALGVVYGFDQILDEANVVVWGYNFVGQLNVPPGLSNVVAIAGAYDHSLALKNNGTAVSWGDNPHSASLAVPAGLNNLVAVAGGESYSLALKNSGTVVAWGVNTFSGETNVPPGLNNVVTIASGTYSSLALRNNGDVVAWGPNIFSFGLTNVPAGLSNAVAIAGGSLFSMVIKNDGTVVAWGYNNSGQTNVPAGLSNVVAIAAGDSHGLALKYDGTVVAWGDNSDGQTDVPAGLSNVVAVTAGGFNSLALKNDGSVVAWGYNSFGQTSVPVGLTNVVAIAGGNLHSLALTPQSVSSLISPVVLDTTNGVPQTDNIFAGGVVFYRVNVPTNADFATNSLLYTLNGPLNVWFTTNTPPTIATINDSLLFGAATNGVSILSTTSVPTNIVPGSTYYLGVQNTNSFAVTYGIEVDFHLLSLTNPIFISGIVYTNIGGTNGFLLTWFAPSNDLFQVQWTGNLPPTSWATFTNIVSYNPNAFTLPLHTQFNFFDDGAQFPFGPARFYQLILLQGALTNGMPQTNSVPAGGVDSFLIHVPTNADFATNLLLSATGPLNVWFDTNAPSATNILLISGTNGSYTLSTTGTPPLAPGSTYYLSVQNTNSVAMNFGIEVDFHLVPPGPTNGAPVLPVQGTRVLNPLNPLVVTNTAVDADVPAQTLTYVISSTVTGTNAPVINTNTGVITWTPTLGQSGTSNMITTVVMDNGVPPMSATNEFAVVVNPVPGLGSVIYTNGGFLLTWYAPTNDQFKVEWSGDLVPPQTWTGFSNIVVYTGPPTPTNGLFAFFDDGSQYPFSGGLRFYRLRFLGLAAVGPTNGAPVLPVQGTRVLNPLNPLVVTNTAVDADVPAQTLTYVISSTVTGTNAPVINTNTGVITWTPTLGQSGTSNMITTVVMDNGVPPMSATNEFAVVVNPVPGLGSVIYTNGGFLLTWYAPTNDQFKVEWSGDLVPPQTWTGFSNIVVYTGPPTPTNGLFAFFDDGSQYPFSGGLRFYRLRFLGLAAVGPTNGAPVLPVQGTRVLNPLNPLVVTNTAVDADVPAQTLTYVISSTVTGTNAPVINTNTGVITWTPTLGQSGTSNMITTVVMDNGVPPMSATNEFAVVVNPVPGLGSVIYTNGGFLLTWYAPTNDQFKVEWSGDLVPPQTWTGFSNIVVYTGPPTPTNGLFAFFDDGSQYPFSGGLRFYRLRFLGLAAVGPTNGAPVLPVQSNLVVNVSTTVTVTNTATDSNTNAILTYILTSSPAGAAISSNGIITWTNAVPAGNAARFTTVVSDDSVPPLTVSNTFTIFVAPFPAITNVTITTTNVTLQWSAPTNDQFQVQWTADLTPVVNWFTFPAVLTSSGGAFTFTDTNAPLIVKFYRLLLLP